MTISDYLESDHRRLDALLPDVLTLLEKEDVAAAAEQFAEFSAGLRRHIDAEERVLFPVFEEKTGITGGPTQVMRMEHQEIKSWMTRISDALSVRNVSGARQGLNMLTDVLSSHNMKEEHILYPMTDGATDDSERAALVREMQAI